MPFQIVAFVLSAGLATFTAYNIYKDLNNPTLNNIPEARWQSHFINYEELNKKECELQKNWYQVKNQFLALLKKVFESQEIKIKCLKIFCFEYMSSIQDFYYYSFVQKLKAVDLDIIEHRRAIKNLYAKKQLKIKDIRLVNQFIQRTLELPLAQFTEQMQDYQKKIRISNLNNADQIIQRKPFPCPETLKLSSDLNLIQHPEKEVLNDL